MVVRIRLQRHGRIHRPFYRIAIADSHRHVSKKVIDYIGTYDPLVDKHGVKQLRLNVPRVKYWIAVGAQPSDTVRRLLAQFNLLPVPPRRSLEQASAPLLRGMAGRGGEGELAGEQEGVDGRQVRASWLYRSTHTQQSEAATGEAAAEGTAAAADGGVENKPSQLKRFPFSFIPSSSTLTAWQQTRQRWSNGAAAKRAGAAETATTEGTSAT